MNNASSIVESQIKTLATQFIGLMNSAAQIVKNYNSTNSVTLVTALSTGTTPATVSTALDKTQFVNGIALCTQLGNFFSGSAVTSADYLATCQNLISGNTSAGSVISPGVEALGQQMFTLAQNMITFYQGAVIANGAYNQNGLAQTVSAIDSALSVPGCSTSAGVYTNGITMVLQFINMMTNQAVFAESYFNVALQWTQS